MFSGGRIGQTERFKRSNHCLASLPTPLPSDIRDSCKVHEDGMDDLSRHDLEEVTGCYGVKRADTGMRLAVGGVGSTKFAHGRLEGGSDSLFAANQRRSHRHSPQPTQGCKTS